MTKVKRDRSIQEAIKGLFIGVVLMIIVILFAHHILGLEYFPA
ncbi:hypothetical protein [Alkalihalobacillus trypoxylicola]|nr:hypothetical protein [Alkalihalobacillus trypoxylicola]GAF64438.1 hypothetical protein BTS2_1331 [Bacillus sp. TS-2]